MFQRSDSEVKRPVLGRPHQFVRKLSALVSSVIVLFLVSIVDSSSKSTAVAANVPDAPSVRGKIQIISDNDYALFAGTETNVTRLLQQNNDVFWDQVGAAESYRIALEDGETHLYLLGMGGGGAEDIGGTLNGVDVTAIPPGANGLQRAVSRPGGNEQDGYFVLQSFLTGWNDASYGNCGGAITVCFGQYPAELSEVRTALTGAVWGNPPSVGWGQAGNAFAYPDSSAVMFRMKVSTLGTGLTVADGTSVSVGWEAPASDGGAAILDYTVTAFRASDNSSAGRSCTTANGSARSCSVTGLPGGTRYYFKVTARNSIGSSSAGYPTGAIAIVDNTPVTTTTTSTTSTTVPVVNTTVPPALDIVVVAPSTSLVPGTTLPVGQSQIPRISETSQTTTSTAVPLFTTITTVASRSSESDEPQAPLAPSVVAGSAAVKVGDTTQDAKVERTNNQLVVSAGLLQAIVGGLNPDGSQVALDDDGNVRLKSGDAVRIKLAGFKPSTMMEAWLFSTPMLLGTTKVGANGTVTGTFVIPDKAPEGAHRVVIVAQTTDGKPATLAIGINVGEWDSGPDVAIWLIVLPIALAILGALVVPAQRRRRRASKVA